MKWARDCYQVVQLCRESVSDGKTTFTYGSGYLIGKDRVLTAAHVLCDKVKHATPDDPIGPMDDSILIRLHYEKERKGRVRGSARDRGWYRAKRIWPADTKSSWDVALLQVPEEEVAAGFLGPAFWDERGRMPQVSAAPENPANAELYGYPEYLPRQTHPQNHQGRDYQVKLHAYTNREFRRRPMSVLTNAQSLPADAAGWGQLSGAAVFCRDKLIGVVHRAENRTVANNALVFEPIEALLADPGFAQVSGLRGTAARAAPQGRRPDLLDLDRGNEVALFDMDFDQRVGEDLPGAVLVIQQGHSLDDLATCTRRYLRDVVFDKLSSRFDAETLEAVYGGLAQVHLAQPGREVERRVKVMLNKYVSELDTGTRLSLSKPLEEMEHDLSGLLEGGDAARAVALVHRFEQVDQSCCDASLRMASILANAHPSGPPLFVFVQFLTGEAFTPTDTPYPLHKTAFDAKVELLNNGLLGDLERALDGGPLGLPILLDPPEDVVKQDLKQFVATIEAWLGAEIDRQSPAGESYDQLLLYADLPYETARRVAKDLITAGDTS